MGKILSCQRNQFESKLKSAKERTAKVLQDGKTPAETKALIESLLAILEIVVVVLLEKKARKNSDGKSNSGLPHLRILGRQATETGG